MLGEIGLFCGETGRLFTRISQRCDRVAGTRKSVSFRVLPHGSCDDVAGECVARGSLVVVSNRVPLPSERGPRAGGLAVALADALQPGSLWFGWSGRRSGAPARGARMQRADGITYATIDLSEAEYRSFYVNFANGALWPLLHFRLGLVEFRREDYEGYRAVNRRFAAALRPAAARRRPDLGA